MCSVFSKVIFIYFIFTSDSNFLHCRQRMRDQIASNQPIEGRINQQIIYQGQTNQTSRPGIRNGTARRTVTFSCSETCRPNQCTSIQEQYNSSLTPYGVIQVPFRTNRYLTQTDDSSVQLPTYTAEIELDQPPAYSSIAIRNSNDYNLMAETRRESQEPPPPSYEEITTNPNKYLS